MRTTNINFRILVLIYLQLLSLSTPVEAYTYLYEFDTSHAILEHKVHEKLIQHRTFSTRDKLLLEVNTKFKNVDLLVNNATVGTCTACSPRGMDNHADDTVNSKYVNSVIDFRLRLFDHSDWSRDGNSRNDQITPFNFSDLESNPQDIYANFFNYDSPWVNRMLEIAGVAIALNFSLIDGELASEYFDAYDRRFYEYTTNSSYLVSKTDTYFYTPLGSHPHSFAITDVGKATLISPNVSAVPEPASLGLLALGIPRARRMVKLRRKQFEMQP